MHRVILPLYFPSYKITETNFLPGEETLSLSKYLYHFIRYRWNFILHAAFPPSRCGFLFLLTTSLHANQLMENRGMRYSWTAILFTVRLLYWDISKKRVSAGFPCCKVDRKLEVNMQLDNDTQWDACTRELASLYEHKHQQT